MRDIIGIGGQVIMPVLRMTAAAFAIIALSASVAARAQQPTIPTVGVITAEKRPVTESVRFNLRGSAAIRDVPSAA